MEDLPQRSAAVKGGSSESSSRAGNSSKSSRGPDAAKTRSEDLEAPLLRLLSKLDGSDEVNAEDSSDDSGDDRRRESGICSQRSRCLTKNQGPFDGEVLPRDFVIPFTAAQRCPARELHTQSFDARLSFVDFAAHQKERGTNLDENIAQQQNRDTWYQSSCAVQIHKLANHKCFTLLSLFFLCCSLCCHDLSIMLQVPTNKETDVLLTSALVFLLLEFVLLTASEDGYAGSCIFFMDMVGTCSLVFDISTLAGPNASEVERLTSSYEASAVSLLRLTRPTRLIARVGRFSRLLNTLRTSREGSSEDENLGDGELGNGSMTPFRVAYKIADALAVRMAILTTTLVLCIQALRELQHPSLDQSLVAWTQWMAADAEDYLRVQSGSAASSHLTKARVHLEEATQRCSSFYDQAYYRPYFACMGKLIETASGLTCDGFTVDFHLGDDFAAPRRRSSILESSIGDFHVLFDMSREHCTEAAIALALMLFIITIVVCVVTQLSAQVTAIALTPLEVVIRVLRDRCKSLFKSSPLFADVTEDLGDGHREGEFVALESAISKLGAILQVCSRRSEPEVKVQVDWTQNSYSVDVLKTEKLERTDLHHRILRKKTVDQIVQESMQAGSVVAHVSLDLARAMATEDFDTTALAEGVKRYVATYALWHMDGNREYTESIVKEQTMLTFMTKCEQGYKPNKFHNWDHAIDVMCALSQHLSRIEAERFLTEQTQFYILIAAIGHDLGHQGVSNNFIVECSHDLAVMYNDMSPLENMHCARLFQIVGGDPAANVFAQMSKEEYRECRSGIISAILHTDIVKHNEMKRELGLFFQLNAPAFASATAEDAADATEYEELLGTHKHLIVNMLLHTADIGNPMKPWPLCEKLANLCMDEFFAQGDMEKTMGLPVGMLNDRDKVNRPNSQIGFIEFMVAPWIENVVQILPNLDNLARHCDSNLHSWFEAWVAEGEAQEDAIEKMQSRVEKTSSRLRGESLRKNRYSGHVL